MARAGRKTKYTPEMVEDIVKLSKSGCTINDICSKINIGVATYFEWINKYPEFAEQVVCARAEANIGATLSLRKAMMPHDVTSRTVKTLKETRLRKVRGKDGVSEQPYEYTKVEQSETVSNEFDWRAALEYLKRRDPEHWGDKLIIVIKPEWQEVLDKYGKTAGDVMEEVIQKLDKAAKEASNG